MPSPFDKEVLTSSPVDMDATRKANATLNQLLASKVLITTPVRNYIACMTRQNERLYARNSILTQRIEAATEVLNGRKKQLSGKRKSVNGTHIMTGEELLLVRRSEEATRQRKRKRTNEALTT